MALNGLFCADVPLRNYSLTRYLTGAFSGSWGPAAERHREIWTSWAWAAARDAHSRDEV